MGKILQRGREIENAQEKQIEHHSEIETSSIYWGQE